MNKAYSLLVASIALLGLSACSSKPAIYGEDTLKPKYVASDVLKNGSDYQIDVYDPWEGFNRSVYKFNVGFDRAIFMPIVRGYRFLMPDFAERGVSNFFANIDDLNTLMNSALQLEGDKTAHTVTRLMMNSTLGLAGLVDVATYMGVPDHAEDFGETLASYGVGAGPYLVLPVLGPSNLRDATGKVVDAVAFAAVDPLNFDKNDLGIPYSVSNGINARHVTSFQYYDDSTPFEYEWVRMLTTKQREIEAVK